MRGYLPFIWKDSVTYMHEIAVYVNEELAFARDLSLENSMDFYLCFQLALLHLVSYLLILYSSSSFLYLCTVLDAISSNLDKLPLNNPSADVFGLCILFFEDFNVHHKDVLTYSNGTDRTCELCFIIFLSQMIFLRCLTFLLKSLTVKLIVLLFRIYFFLLTLVFILQWFSLHCIKKLWSYCCLSLYGLSSKLKRRCFISLHTYDILGLIGMVFMIIWDMFYERISLNSVICCC